MRLSLAVTKTYSDWPMTIYNNHTMIDQLPFETNRYEQDANKNISKTKKNTALKTILTAQISLNDSSPGRQTVLKKQRGIKVTPENNCGRTCGLYSYKI